MAQEKEQPRIGASERPEAKSPFLPFLHQDAGHVRQPHFPPV